MTITLTFANNAARNRAFRNLQYRGITGDHGQHVDLGSALAIKQGSSELRVCSNSFYPRDLLVDFIGKVGAKYSVSDYVEEQF